MEREPGNSACLPQTRHGTCVARDGRGRGFVGLLGPPPLCFGNADCHGLFPHPHWPSPCHASQRGRAKPEPQKHAPVIGGSVWGLVLVCERDKDENFPVLGTWDVFLSPRFVPLKCGCEKQMFSKAENLRNSHRGRLTPPLRAASAAAEGACCLC